MTYKSWYKTARWQKLRWSILVRDLFTCQLCGVIERDTSQLVCDHVEPHKGDEAKFWAGPFQTLCKACHDGHKQSIEKGGAGRAAIGPDGWPIEGATIPGTTPGGGSRKV